MTSTTTFNTQKVNTSNAENFQWGTGCQGWHLLANDQLTITQEIMPPKSAGVVHYHEVAEQFLYILQGEAAIVIEGEMQSLYAGDGIYLTPSSKHQIRNDSDKDVHLIAVSSPNSFHDFKDKNGQVPDGWKPDFFPDKNS